MTESRVTIQFIGADAGLTATAGGINTQLGKISATAATLTGKLGELTQASQSYSAELKALVSSTNKLEKAGERLAKQEIAPILRQQAKEAQALADAQKRAEAEAVKLVAAQRSLAQSRAKEQLGAEAETLRGLAQSVKEAATEAEKLFKANDRLAGQNVADQLEKQRQGYQTLALASGAVAASIGSLFTQGIKSFTDFSGSITQLGVVTQTTGTEKLGALRAEIERLAAVTSKTPTEIAALSVSLARAGFTADKIKDSLAAIVQGAEATATVPETFGKVVGAIIESYQLQASESAKVSDALVAGSNAAGLKIDELGEAFKRAGPTASGANQSYKETIATLGILRAANLEGSVAGSGYVAILNRLKIASAANTSEFANLVKGNKAMVGAFRELQVEARNADGSLKPLSEIVPQIQAKLANFSKGDADILKKALFGDQGSAAFNALTAVSKDRIDQITNAVNNSEGAAATASKVLTGDLAGSFNVLRGSTELLTNKFGEFAAVGILPLVQGATTLINTFLALPAPIQGTLIATTAFVGIVAAAVTAISAYNLAIKTLAIGQAAETLTTIASTFATKAATFAKFLFTTQITLANLQLAISSAQLALTTAATGLYAAATQGAAVAAGSLSTALLAVIAPLAALAAGVAIVGIVKLTEQISDQNNALQELRATTDQVLQTGISAQTKLKSAIDAQNKSKETGIALTKEQIAAEERALKQAEGALKLLKDQLAQAERTPQATAGFGGIGKEEADAQNTARQTNIASIKQQIGIIERQKKALDDSTDATNKNTKATDADGGDRSAKDRGEDLKEKQQDAKAKADADFQDTQRGKQQGFQDKERQKEQAFNDAKQQREQSFRDAQTALDRQAQTEKETRAAAFQSSQAALDNQTQAAKQQREAAFQASQAAIDKQNQADKQARESEFQKQQQQAESAFKDGQRQRDEQRQASQSEAARQLGLEGSRGGERRKLERQQTTRDNVDNLTDADLEGRSAEELADLAKQSAGADNLKNKRDREQAEIALQAIIERQNKLAKEAERKEEEAFKAKQKQEDEAFKARQDAIDAAKEIEKKNAQAQFKTEQDAIDLARENEKKERDRQFKVEQDAIDTRNETEKRDRERQFKSEQDTLDRQRETEKREAQRQFEAGQREAERKFKDEQREKDRANADAIKGIIESAKIPAPKLDPVPVAVPRFTGGDVQPGVRYLGGEKGVEAINFGGGKRAMIGENGAEFFQVERRGYVHPNHSSFTQQALQAGHFQQQTLGRSPNVNVSPTATVVYSDDALLREMRKLRSEVASMRPINQSFEMTPQTPMDQVYKVMKAAAREY